MVKSPLAKQEIWVRSLDWEDPLEDGTTTYSSILAWRIPQAESMAGYSPQGCKSQARVGGE